MTEEVRHSYPTTRRPKGEMRMGQAWEGISLGTLHLCRNLSRQIPRGSPTSTRIEEE